MNEKRMTFGEHLEELRWRLMVAVATFFLALIVSVYFDKELFKVFIGPFTAAVADIKKQHEAAGAARVRESDPWKRLEAEKDPLARQQLHSQVQAKALFDLGGLNQWTEAQLREVGLTADGSFAPIVTHGDLDLEPELVATGATEGFMSHFKVSLLVAALISAPVLLYHLWSFIAAGLYDNERRIVTRFLPFSLALFGMGLVFSYYILVPISLEFFLNYGAESLRKYVQVNSYLSLLFLLLLLMGLVFQIPLFMTGLARTGLVTTETLRKKRKFCILGVFIISALLTPPDYVTQILVALPMLVLFELGMVLARVAEKRKKASGATA